MSKYCLMHKDIVTAIFDDTLSTVEFEDLDLLPICMKGDKSNVDAMKTFVGERILQVNRENFKDILLTCGIEDQTDVNILIASNGLSFRDNYWIKEYSSDLTWHEINLYKNEFSKKISYIAITGEYAEYHLDDKIYTGELTGKGTRAKCFYRQGDSIYLLKRENEKEINAEVLSYYLASKMCMRAAQYIKVQYAGYKCSCCKIDTNEHTELIHYSEFLKQYNCQMGLDTKAFNYFLNVDAHDFLSMMLFDYITLNTDRNRNNFGLRRDGGEFYSLYSLYDHDSCFKGKSTDAIYFVTGISYKDSLEFLRENFPRKYNGCCLCVSELKKFLIEEGEYIFNEYGLIEELPGVLRRIDDILEEPGAKLDKFINL